MSEKLCLMTDAKRESAVEAREEIQIAAIRFLSASDARCSVTAAAAAIPRNETKKKKKRKKKKKKKMREDMNEHWTAAAEEKIGNLETPEITASISSLYRNT